MCFGIGSSDKLGELKAEEYDEELRTMADEYKAALDAGGCFVHIRPKHSSNKDLKMLSQLTGKKNFIRVNLEGEKMESVVTNSKYIAEVLKKASCDTREKVEKELEKEIKGESWEDDRKTFEQHMHEEDEARVDWK